MAPKNCLNEYKESLLSVQDAIDILLMNKSVDDIVLTDKKEIELYNNNVEEVLHHSGCISYPTKSLPVTEYFQEKAKVWFMPDKYKHINIKDFLINRCKTQAERDRVLLELSMYSDRNLEDVLRFLIYFVDYLRENEIMWGVGRGSSVASYVLFLIGIHKIDSLEYGLCVEEFLR